MKELQALAATLSTQGIESHIVVAEGGPGGPAVDTGLGSKPFALRERVPNPNAVESRKVLIEITDAAGAKTKWELIPSRHNPGPVGTREIVRAISALDSRYQGGEFNRIA